MCIRGHRSQHNQRNLKAGRAKRKERVGTLAGCTIDHNRSLTGIVEHKARQHQAVPGEADRAWPEMAHVGVKRFGPRRAKKYRAENQKTGKAVSEKVSKTEAGIDGREHARMLQNSD